MSTFSKMAEEWMQENMPTAATSQAATKATEDRCSHTSNAWPQQLAPDDLADDLLADLRQPFTTWVDSRCILNSRWSTALTCLHESFCEWCVTRDVLPCDRTMFELMLIELGFQIGTISRTTLVLNLALKSEVIAHERFQKGAQ